VQLMGYMSAKFVASSVWDMDSLSVEICSTGTNLEGRISYASMPECLGRGRDHPSSWGSNEQEMR
jgi:hypothetical protein